MDKIQNLFIRACKISKSKNRILRLYKKYYATVKDPMPYVAGILIEICEAYAPIKTVKLLDELSPYSWRYSQLISYHEKIVDILISHLACTKVDKFGSDYVRPAWANKIKIGELK